MSNDTFFAHKMQEVKVLAKYARIERLPSNLCSVSRVLAYKFRLKRELRRVALMRSSRLSESNLGDVHKPIARSGCCEIAYGYGRFDLTLKGAPIHFVKCSQEVSSCTIPTTCGMAAISLVFFALKHVWQNIHCVYQDEGYFESVNVLRMLRIPSAAIPYERSDMAHKVPGAAERVLFIDSYLGALPKAFPTLEGFICVVIDSTCLGRGDLGIARWIDECLRSGCIVCVARSHLKLDSFGVEYGRLGSLEVFGRSDSGFSMFGKFCDTLEVVATLCGFRAESTSIYPWLWDKDAVAVNELRIARLREGLHGVRDMIRELAESRGFRCNFYEHGLFVAISEVKAGLMDPELLKKSLRHASLRRGLRVREADSFGFDFVSWKVYRDMLSSRVTLRLTTGDLPLDMLATEVFQFLLKGLVQNA